MRRQLLPGAIGAALILALGVVAAFAATSSTTLQPGDQVRLKCNGARLTTSRVSNSEVVAKCGTISNPTNTPTTTAPTAAGTTTSSPATPTPTSTPRPATATPTAIPPTATPTTPTGSVTAPMIGGCQVFPQDNAWNQDVSAAPLHANSANYISRIAALGGNQKLHADFGSDPTYGIPPGRAVYPAGGPHHLHGAGGDGPTPARPRPNAPIEGGAASTGDRHVLVLQQGTCKLYELYRSFFNGSGWNADSGARYWNLPAPSPLGWTSADAAGLPILPASFAMTK
ncbi:MAG: hypothetical protein IPH65_10635 [Dehalococcoidia bacterium]|uniref:hypothetical protein n=1 Tax=Candidatus Amarobacter glycogenicus TaxID=3140699 RepID=UPI003135E43F|nr:hypothetical protein [Dehalococcoidia bacterium]